MNNRFKDFLQKKYTEQSEQSSLIVSNPVQTLIREYVHLSYQVDQPPEEWDHSILNQLRDDILAAEAELDYKFIRNCLAHLDILEDQQKAQWQLEINPNIYEDAYLLQSSQARLQKTIRKSTITNDDGISEKNVMYDVLRQNGEVNKEKNFVTDVYLGNDCEQVVFDVSYEVDNKKSIETTDLVDNERLINHWKTSVEKMTDNTALIDVVLLCSTQTTLTHLLLNVLNEELNKKHENQLSCNPKCWLGDPKSRVYITVSPSEELKYKIDFVRRDAKNKLIYKLSGEISIKKTNDKQSPPLSLEVVNAKIAAYDPRAKYNFPTLYNRGYLEQQLEAIELTEKLINYNESSDLKLEIKKAIREASSLVVDKLSCHDFEQFVFDLKKTLIDKAEKKASWKEIRFIDIAKDLAENRLQNTVRDIITSYIKPNEEKNQKLLEYYLNDIDDANIKIALQDMANDKKILTLPRDKFNMFLANSMFSFAKIAESDYEIAKMHAEDSVVSSKSSFFVRDVYESLNDLEKKNLHRFIKEHTNNISFDSQININKYDSHFVPRLVINFILSSAVLNSLQMKNASKQEKDAVKDIINDITDMLVPNFYLLFNLKDRAKQYLEEIASDVLEQIKKNEGVDHQQIVYKNVAKAVLEKDFINKKKNMKDLPGFYATCVLPGIEKDAGDVLKDNSKLTDTEAVVTVINRITDGFVASFNQPLTQQDIISQARNYVMKTKISYIQPLYDKIVKENKQEFENISFSLTDPPAQGSTFTPNTAQKAILRQLAAFDELHYQRCQQFYGVEHANTRRAQQQATNSKVAGLQINFQKFNMTNPSSTEVFNRYLLDMESSLRDTLDTERNQNEQANASDREQELMIAKQKMAVINRSRYFDKESKFYKKTVGVLLGALADRNIIFKDFSKKWYDDVLSELSLLTSGQFNIEKRLAILKDLEREGETFANKQWFISKLILKDKLKVLHQFIEDMTIAYGKNEGQLVLHKIRNNQVPAGDNQDLVNKTEAFNKILKKQKTIYASDLDKIQEISNEKKPDAGCLPLFIPNEKVDLYSQTVQNKFTFFNKAQDQIHFDNIGKLEKAAEEELGPDIVRLRIKHFQK